jgi:hypothetical protein
MRLHLVDMESALANVILNIATLVDLVAEHAVTPQSLVSDGKRKSCASIGRPKNTRAAGCGLFAGPRSGGPPAAGPAMGPAAVLTRAFLDSGPGGPGRARSLPGQTRFFFCP